MYYIWRRSDGYVSATCYIPQQTRLSTFEILKTSEDWTEEIVEFIQQQRDAVKQ